MNFRNAAVKYNFGFIEIVVIICLVEVMNESPTCFTISSVSYLLEILLKSEVSAIKLNVGRCISRYVVTSRFDIGIYVVFIIAVLGAGWRRRRHGCGCRSYSGRGEGADADCDIYRGAETPAPHYPTC